MLKMPRVRHLAVASAMALIASAQTSSAPVTQVLIPFADQQGLVASVIGEVSPPLLPGLYSAIHTLSPPTMSELLPSNAYRAPTPQTAASPNR